jgi:hypothetical protein
MDCVETRTMLSSYHDGELAPADRARVDEHLRGCVECSAVLSRLAEIDAHAGVPEPGPEYWERFNRRVMERLGGAPAPAKALRPKRGWARRRLPYFIPAAAAAALLLVVVRQTGMDPFSRTPPPPASPPATQASSQALPEKAPQALPEEASQDLPRPPRPAPPQAAHRREAAESRPSAAGHAAMDMEMKGAPGEERERSAPGVDAMSSAPAGVGKAKKAERALSKSTAAAAPAVGPSPCEDARALAGRGLLEEAESAQRACLARKNPPEAQEEGMVFLAELLDRQSRIAEADSVLEETRRQFPASRPLDSYLRQRSEVQGRRLPSAP